MCYQIHLENNKIVILTHILGASCVRVTVSCIHLILSTILGGKPDSSFHHLRARGSVTYTEEYGLWIEAAWVQDLVLPILSCVTLG